ncbi:hypothetical protein UPYG_G00354810 [Umbra pygmaea]|uniref:C-type lectin domain-containing protein n=1 Tax=Umbra pygmaea TaxID=75934 RepID=A0ABD0W9D3_UMBPY
MSLALYLMEVLMPTGWKRFGSSWYFVSNEKKSWESSRQDCLSRGANLVTINSQEEQKFLHGLGRNSAMYIGLHDIITEGGWEWTGFATSGQSSSSSVTHMSGHVEELSF